MDYLILEAEQTNEPIFEPFYNKHYITVDEQSRIIDGWSDGPHPDRPADGATLLTDQGGYQFRLSPNGEENPMLLGMDGIPIYKWDGTQVLERTQEEIEADRAALPVPEPVPTAEDVLNALLGVTS